jgi:hypothetical protein
MSTPVSPLGLNLARLIPFYGYVARRAGDIFPPGRLRESEIISKIDFTLAA